MLIYGKLINGLKAQLKPKAQDFRKVFNFAEANKTKCALVGIFVLQFVNLILLYLYPLSTAVYFSVT